MCFKVSFSLIAYFIVFKYNTLTIWRFVIEFWLIIWKVLIICRRVRKYITYKNRLRQSRAPRYGLRRSWSPGAVCSAYGSAPVSITSQHPMELLGGKKIARLLNEPLQKGTSTKWPSTKWPSTKWPSTKWPSTKMRVYKMTLYKNAHLQNDPLQKCASTKWPSTKMRIYKMTLYKNAHLLNNPLQNDHLLKDPLQNCPSTIMPIY